MKKLKLILIICFVFMININFIYSAFDYTTTSSARVMGMGGAFVAVEHAGEGNLVNPATFDIDQVNYGSAIIMYSPLFIGLDQGIFYNGFANVSYFLPRIGVFSINWAFLKISTDAVSSLYNENEVVLTYMRKIASSIYSGLKINYYHWSSARQTDFYGHAESLSTSAFSIGIGAYYKIRTDFAMGLSANNLNQPRMDDTSKGKEDIEKMPIEVQPGLAFNIKKLLLTLDVRFITENIDILFGSEYWFLNKDYEKFIGARVGMIMPNLANGINATAGFSVFVMKGLSVDYAFMMPIVTIKSIWGEHKFSMSYRF